ncbi:long-chain-fatty-acid--CoA ligase ACSBG2 isoform X2 [Microcebus murinus]|uniref:long-chain-fatty-acid--CoA ligase ACSBG2 isoform X2 n=1 Tax=Microcebus murinus TaxID=30608 RepID=UPI003F6B6E44
MPSKKARSAQKSAERSETTTVNYWTSRRNGEVRLRKLEDAFYDRTPLTVHDMVIDTATRFTNYIALGSKYKNTWHLLTYIEYYEQCRQAAKAFLKLGLERFHGVGIMGLNSEEWAIAYIGAIMAGGFSVGILSTNTPKACQIIAENSKMNVIVVDNDKQLQKVMQIQGYLKHLKGIVQYKEVIQSEQRNLYSWQRFLDLSHDISDERLDKIIDSQKPNQCCTLVFSLTSMGPPKAVMLSHDNITWTTAATVQSLSFKRPPEAQETLVSYLPLSYIGSQIFDMWVAISVAGALYFAQPDAVKGTLIDTLREVRPTTFYGVPGIWDQMADSLKARHLGATMFRRKFDNWAMVLGLKTNLKQMFGCGKPFRDTNTKVLEGDKDGIGDICIWGRNVFMGYLNNKEATKDKIDSLGWMHTGDLGFLDADNFLHIAGNVNDIITLSSGEKINPGPIEEQVKMFIPIVHYVVLVGQDMPYLCALLTLKCQVNVETGEPRDALTEEAVDFCRNLKSHSTRLSDIINNQDSIVMEYVDQAIDVINREARSESARIVKWTILDTDFSIGAGELGVTTKVKRGIVYKMYQAEIEKFYEN